MATYPREVRISKLAYRGLCRLFLKGIVNLSGTIPIANMT